MPRDHSGDNRARVRKLSRFLPGEGAELGLLSGTVESSDGEHVRIRWADGSTGEYPEDQEGLRRARTYAEHRASQTNQKDAMDVAWQGGAPGLGRRGGRT
jgi:hypothetical protein